MPGQASNTSSTGGLCGATLGDKPEVRGGAKITERENEAIETGRRKYKSSWALLWVRAGWMRATIFGCGCSRDKNTIFLLALAFALAFEVRLFSSPCH